MARRWRRMRQLVRWCAIAAALVLAHSHAWSASIDTTAAPGVVGPPAPTNRLRLAPDVSKLPSDARGHWPAYDGDPLFVSFRRVLSPVVSVEDVRRMAVQPVLDALGFKQGPCVVVDPVRPVLHPRATVAPLARAFELEIIGSPALARAGTLAVLDALTRRPGDGARADSLLMLVERTTVAGLVADLERQALVYVFPQVCEGRIVDERAILATRWEGETVHTVHGSMLTAQSVVNAPTLDPGAAEAAAVLIVRKLYLEQGAPTPVVGEGPVPVLLPYGSLGDGRTILRHAYRLELAVETAVGTRRYIVWVDAADGSLLKLHPLVGNATVWARVFKRDPAAGTIVVPLEIDDPGDGAYVLRRAGVLERIDYAGDHDDANDMKVPTSQGANWDRPPLNDASQAICSTGTNREFVQVHTAATVLRHHDVVRAQGIFSPFPRYGARSVLVNAGACDANPSVYFGVCGGFLHPDCPRHSDGTSDGDRLSYAHDSTLIGHELGHSFSWWLTLNRPIDWCGPQVCPRPVGWSPFHDLADVWADDLESTNCFSGWFGKNIGGVNASLWCRGHHEGEGIPRRHEVLLPFDPTDPRDHFPEHRRLAAQGASGEYGNGQIAAAALWEVRSGLRSLAGPTGQVRYGIFLQRALAMSGFTGFLLGKSDTDVHRMLYDLHFQLANQWVVSDGASTFNKVAAGMARAGLFLIPYQCLDGKAETTDPTACPTGEDGGDSVVDVDDDVLEDDVHANGVHHRETDYLAERGHPPMFHVWTGPRYRLDGVDGDATDGGDRTPPCNARFRVEVSRSPDFLRESGLIPSPVIDAGTACYGSWRPTADEWRRLLDAAPSSPYVYYRSWTYDAEGGRARSSLQPGAGLWTVPAPYAIVTPDGRPLY